MGLPDLDRIENPHVKLAKLIETVTGLTVEPEAVRKLVARHWRQVQSLAHQIREDDIERRAIARFKRTTTTWPSESGGRQDKTISEIAADVDD